MAYRDGSKGSPFENRSDDDFATFADLIHVLDKLVIHFSQISDEDFEELTSDLKSEDSLALSRIFESMAEYYMNRDLELDSDADLFVVFDSLTRVFEQYSMLPDQP